MYSIIFLVKKSKLTAQFAYLPICDKIIKKNYILETK